MGEGLAGDAERGDEADPVRIVTAVRCGVGHQGADREVAAQVAPDLLEHQVGRLGAQHGAWSALVGLELVERRLDLPPLRVGGGQIGVHSEGLGRGSEFFVLLPLRSVLPNRPDAREDYRLMRPGIERC